MVRAVSIACRLSLAFALALPAGCATFRGGPAPLFEQDKLDASFAPEAQLKVLVGTNDVATRNLSVRYLLAAADVRYDAFRRDLLTHGRHSHSVSEWLLNATNIAASLTTSAGVKDNYLALSSLVQGSDSIYTKEYLYSKTLDALVAQMDANRKQKLVVIMESMNQEFADYPPQAALADILDYENAGTLAAAVQGAQQSAAEQSAASEQALRTLKVVTVAERKTRQETVQRMARFVGSLSDAQMAMLHGFLVAKGDNRSTFAAATTSDERQLALRQSITYVRTNFYPDADAFIADLQAAGFTVPP
jgi:hypothetical protein